MFGSLARQYFRRRPGRYSTYRTKGLKRFRGFNRYGRRKYNKRRRGLTSANRCITMIHRIEEYNQGAGDQQIKYISGALDVKYHETVLLSQFPGTKPFVDLYHQFRIKKVIYEFFPVNMQGRFNTEDVDLTKLYTPTLYTSINRTATGFADNVTKMASTNSMRSAVAGRYHKRVFTPCTLGQTYQSAVETAYNPEYNEWLSTEDTSTPHFGMDVLLSSSTSPPGSFKYKMRTTIIAQYKNRKANIELS